MAAPECGMLSLSMMQTVCMAHTLQVHVAAANCSLSALCCACVEAASAAWTRTQHVAGVSFESYLQPD